MNYDMQDLTPTSGTEIPMVPNIESVKWDQEQGLNICDPGGTGETPVSVLQPLVDMADDDMAEESQFTLMQ